MVNVTDGADVAVGLVPFELRFGHVSNSSPEAGFCVQG
jgi:hypothetical protein